ncbi:MAG: hypothetical protein K0R71_556 [Bacillales bacterium]|jgi:predicted metal-dependent hydrolase|nr:hypothetical protein [Bacillales bacterium]
MNTRKQLLHLQFKKKQKDLFKIVAQFGLSSQEAINCSQELDKIIYQLQRLNDLKPMIEFLTYFHGNQDYLQCRDILEEHWQTIQPNDKKSVYVGLIHLAFGMYYYRAGNIIVAIEMLSNAVKLLKTDINDIDFIGIDGEKLILLLEDTVKELMEKKPFSPFEIPIINKHLKYLAMENCNKLGLQWFNLNHTPDNAINFKHKMHRSKVTDIRTQQLSFKANIQKLRLCGLL